MFSTYLYFLFLYCVYAYQYMMPDDICDLIDIKYVKYTFQCGEVSCEGPLHYCSDDNVCLYCSMDLCQSPSPPDQCQLQCKKLQLEIIKEHCDEMMKHMRNSTKDNESDMQGYCFDIYHLSGIFTASVVVAIIIVFTAIQLWKRCRNRKNDAIVNDAHFDKCWCFSYQEKRKQNTTCPSEEMTAMCVPSGK